MSGEGLDSRQTDEHAQRSIALALLDCDVVERDAVTVDIRGNLVAGLVVPFHLRSDAPPLARPIVYDHELPAVELPRGAPAAKARLLLGETHRQHGLAAARVHESHPLGDDGLAARAAGLDHGPRVSLRRAPPLRGLLRRRGLLLPGHGLHRRVERRLEAELTDYLGCAETETRLVTGQMANMAVFSALVEYANRADPKAEPRRIGMVMNNHIGKGGI